MAWSRFDAVHNLGNVAAPRKGLWNGVLYPMQGNVQVCQWQPIPAPRRIRRQTGPNCVAPLKESDLNASLTIFQPEPTKFPTLSSVATTISTPPGSSCIVTATATQCAMGPRGQSACVQAQTCASWTASKSQMISMFTPAPSDLPTLPGVGISTPVGSSCLATTTATQCVIGSGDKSACGPTPACATWTAVAQASPATPLQTQSVVCNNENDFPGHGDIDGDAQAVGADTMCIDRPVPDLGPDGNWNASITDSHGINMEYLVNWIDGCTTSVARQPVVRPLGDSGPSCTELLIKAYKDCKCVGTLDSFRSN